MAAILLNPKPYTKTGCIGPSSLHAPLSYLMGAWSLCLQTSNLTPGRHLYPRSFVVVLQSTEVGLFRRRCPTACGDRRRRLLLPPSGLSARSAPNPPALDGTTASSTRCGRTSTQSCTTIGTP